MFFRKKVKENLNCIGEITYDRKRNLWVSKDSLYYIHNVDKENLELLSAKIEAYCVGLKENKEKVIREVIKRVYEEADVEVSGLQIVSISIYPYKNKVSAELSFEEVGSDRLGGHWPLVAVDENYTINSKIGFEG
jgi:hypothetical protein